MDGRSRRRGRRSQAQRQQSGTGAAAKAGSLSTGARRATRFAIEAGAGRGAVRRGVRDRGAVRHDAGSRQKRGAAQGSWCGAMRRGVAAEARCGAAFSRGRGAVRRRVRGRGTVQRGVAVDGGDMARRGRGAVGGGARHGAVRARSALGSRVRVAVE